MRNGDPIPTLEHLLTLCADGVEGYNHAARAVRDPALRRSLAKCAAEREEIASVLTNALVTLGHKPTHHGSLLGAAHRRWLDLLGRLEGDPTGAILDECARGEEQLLVAFAHALGRTLPADVHEIVQAQLGRVLAASAELRGIITASRSAHPPVT